MNMRSLEDQALKLLEAPQPVDLEHLGLPALQTLVYYTFWKDGLSWEEVLKMSEDTFWQNRYHCVGYLKIMLEEVFPLTKLIGSTTHQFQLEKL